MPWPKEHEIRWVEQRVRERELIEREQDEAKPEYERQHPDSNKSGEFSRVDYLAWLLHVRDRLPYQKVGDRLFSYQEVEDRLVAGDPESRKMKAYRACARVEGEFGRGPLRRKRKPLGFAILGGHPVLKPPKRRRASQANRPGAGPRAKTSARSQQSPSDAACVGSTNNTQRPKAN